MDKHKKANLKYPRFMRNGNCNDFKDISFFEKWYVLIVFINLVNMSKDCVK
ncbi:hypothetical protein [Clostridium beijerinckii]|uniref:Uncharacterized protein n=1 Tax=Clostridium beijerinckii TaxID=1520 RepID=A0AAX0BBI1_CLOBE|nr:hypothetical protein [Clostridium beijerinckii]NRT92346.1 hypothetical protein [Clostridium beijerinckii]NYC75511.1 hypothetical protein [Clostridium beijerinckii]